ncbi:MAG: hypothetical protein AB4038_09435 [Prochloraceae cyanobacterium]
MVASSPQIPINLNQQRLTYILEPSLALSHYGLPIAKNLGKFLELWVVREFWHIFNNIHFYQQHPESLQLKIAIEKTPTVQATNQQEIIQAVQDWESVRIATVPTKLNLFWIGDKPSESFLPKNVDPKIISHWELLARSLDNQLAKNSLNHNTLTSAWRDTAALAAILKSAIILTYQPSNKQNQHLPPDICTVFESWGIPCKQIDFDDPVATIERENILHLLIQAGLAKFLWAGLNLAVLQLVVPSASHLHYGTEEIQEPRSPTRKDYNEESVLTPNLWEGAQGFWYSLKS